MKYAARTGAIAAGALSAVLVCQPARADYYAFANSQDFGASTDYGYATLSLLVGKTWIDINTGGFQGWSAPIRIISAAPLAQFELYCWLL